MLILQETKYILFKIEKYVSNIQKKNSFKVVEIVLFADEPKFHFPLLKDRQPCGSQSRSIFTDEVAVATTRGMRPRFRAHLQSLGGYAKSLVNL